MQPLTAFEKWMVRSNTERATKGLEPIASILAQLRAGGYHRVADAVQHSYLERPAPKKVKKVPCPKHLAHNGRYVHLCDACVALNR